MKMRAGCRRRPAVLSPLHTNPFEAPGDGHFALGGRSKSCSAITFSPVRAPRARKQDCHKNDLSVATQERRESEIRGRRAQTVGSPTLRKSVSKVISGRSFTSWVITVSFLLYWRVIMSYFRQKNGQTTEPAQNRTPEALHYERHNGLPETARVDWALWPEPHGGGRTTDWARNRAFVARRHNPEIDGRIAEKILVDEDPEARSRICGLGIRRWRRR